MLVLIFFVLNLLYRHNIIDPSNKAYGLNYGNKQERPAYTREHLFELCSPRKTQRDKEHMIAILDRWKARQETKKPVMFHHQYQWWRHSQRYLYHECDAMPG